MSDGFVRIAACETPAELLPGSKDWKSLAQRVRNAHADILLLNEMPFGPWIAAGEKRDPVRLRHSCRFHEQGLILFPELGVPVVLGTFPVERDGHFVNEAFV